MMENVADVYTLSPIQQGMLFHTISAPDSGVCVEQICCTLNGTLDTARFQTCWQQILDHHPALRTIFLWEGLDEPLQVVRETAHLSWNILDWQHRSADEIQQDISDLLARDRQAGFDLSQAPLIRMTLVRTGAAEHRFIWSFHHLLADGWTVALLISELFDRYAALTTGAGFQPPELLPYRQFIEYLDQQPLDRAEQFWRRYLSGFETPNFLVDPQATIDIVERRCNPYQRQQRALTASTTTGLQSFARDQKITLNTTVLGAWAVALAAHTGEADLVFGRTVAGRTPALAGTDTAIGLFVNTLPLRVRLDSQPLPDWLADLQQQQIEISEYEHSPLHLVQKWSDIERGQPLFENIVVFENYPSRGTASTDCGLAASGFDFLEQSNYPLALLVVPGEQMQLILIHDSSRYSAKFAQRLLARLEQTLAAFVEDPRQLANDISCLTGEDRQRLEPLRHKTRPHTDQRPLFRLIEQHALQHPDAIAVQSTEQCLSYAELNRSAEHLARRLRAAGATPGSFVGLATLRSADMVVGILGIQKAGAAYVPLDPDYPASHLEYVCQDAGLQLIVTNEFSAQLLPSSLPATLVSLDTGPASDREIDKTLAANPDDESLNTLPAYVIYTSGSQGRPKGVAVSHRNLTGSTLARRSFYQAPVERFLLLSSFAFDSSIVGIFSTLADGGTLVLPEPGQEIEMHTLADLIEQHQVTQLLALPSLYAMLRNTVPSGRLKSLKTVIVAGEACEQAVVVQHAQSLPDVRLVNEYGPTEATVWCLATELNLENSGQSVPIGRPIDNMSAYLLNNRLRPVPPGVLGELVVAGAGIVDGYLNQPALTNEKFISDPFAADGSRMYKTGDLAYLRDDGLLVFAGRIDSQIKIRGHRIEPGEIENQLKAHGGIEDVAVVVVDAGEFRSAPAAPDLVRLREQLLATGPLRAGQLIEELLALDEAELARQLDAAS